MDGVEHHLPQRQESPGKIATRAGVPRFDVAPDAKIEKISAATSLTRYAIRPPHPEFLSAQRPEPQWVAPRWGNQFHESNRVQRRTDAQAVRPAPSADVPACRSNRFEGNQFTPCYYARRISGSRRRFQHRVYSAGLFITPSHSRRGRPLPSPQPRHPAMPTGGRVDTRR